MTVYIADHRKKKSILVKREKELRHALKNDYSLEKIEKSAEKVRTANLALFKMKFSRDSVLPASSYKLTDEAIVWKDKSVQDIINEFKC